MFAHLPALRRHVAAHSLLFFVLLIVGVTTTFGWWAATRVAAAQAKADQSAALARMLKRGWHAENRRRRTRQFRRARLLHGTGRRRQTAFYGSQRTARERFARAG